MVLPVLSEVTGLQLGLKASESNEVTPIPGTEEAFPSSTSMVRSTAFAAGLAMTVIVWTSGIAAQELDIQGTWIRTSDDGSHQRGAMLFTPTSYSIMAVAGGEPRTELSDDPSDTEIVVAYRSFVANSGRYRLEGNQLIREAYKAKNPNYMAARPD